MHTAQLRVVQEAEGADDDVFSELYRRFHGRLRRLAARRFPEADCDEVAQEAMLRVLLNLHRLQPGRDPWPYLAAICVNVAKDSVSRPARTVPLADRDDGRHVAPAADESSLVAADQRWVDEILSLMPAGPRRVLALHVFEQLSIGEIAALLGCTDNAVRQLLFRARRHARQMVGG